MAAPLKRFFNMVEVTLALAVVGIGVTGIMGMFPVAIGASRDAIAENYAADASNQFITYLEAFIKNQTQWTSSSGDPANASSYGSAFTSTLPDGPPAVTPSAVTDGFASWTNLTNSTNGGADIYGNSGTPSLYGIKVGNDFQGEVRVWKQPNGVNDFYYGGLNVALPLGRAMRVYVELSWPVTKAYSAREKRYYIMEVYK